MPGLASDALAWLVVGLFAVGVIFAARERERLARGLAAGAWGLFGVFWLQLVPHFAFVHKSYIEGALSLAAVPACLYAGYLLYGGRESLFVLTRAVAVMGAIYLPFETVPAVTVAGTQVPAPKRILIETVAAQTGALMNLLGYHPTLIAGEQGFLNTYRFVQPDGHLVQFSVVLACTGLGSIVIFAGIIAAVDAPVGRKLRALAVSVPVIYLLNLVRTTFIGVVFGKQYMQWAVDTVLLLFGGSDPYMVSFYLSDRVVSQSLALVALIAITYLVVRQLPEVLVVIEDVLYMLTGEEYDLRETLDLPAEPTGGAELAD
jgi:archaeosortase A (PGF-CTERM-specific)